MAEISNEDLLKLLQNLDPNYGSPEDTDSSDEEEDDTEVPQAATPRAGSATSTTGAPLSLDQEEQAYREALARLPQQAQAWRDQAAQQMDQLQATYKAMVEGQKPKWNNIAGDTVRQLGALYMNALPGLYATANGPATGAQPIANQFQKYNEWIDSRRKEQMQQQADQYRTNADFMRTKMGLDKDVWQANQDSQLRGAQFNLESKRQQYDRDRQERFHQDQLRMEQARLGQSAQQHRDMLDLRRAMAAASNATTPFFQDPITQNATNTVKVDQLVATNPNLQQEATALAELTKNFAGQTGWSDTLTQGLRNAARGTVFENLLKGASTEEQQLSVLKTALKGYAQAFEGMPGFKVEPVIQAIERGSPTDVANAAQYLNGMIQNSTSRFAALAKNPKMNAQEYMTTAPIVTWRDIAPNKPTGGAGALDKLGQGDVRGAVGAFAGKVGDTAGEVVDWAGKAAKNVVSGAKPGEAPQTPNAQAAADAAPLPGISNQKVAAFVRSLSIKPEEWINKMHDVGVDPDSEGAIAAFSQMHQQAMRDKYAPKGGK